MEEVNYDAIKDALLALGETLRSTTEAITEIAEELECVFSENLIERQEKYTPVSNIGNINYCKYICRKPIHKARSCC